MEKGIGMQQARSGFFMSKKLVAIVFLFAIMSLAAVGLIVGMFNHNLERVVYNNSYSLECYYDNSTTTTSTTSITTTLSTSTQQPTTSEEKFPPGPWSNSPSLPSYIQPVRYNLHIKYFTFTVATTIEESTTLVTSDPTSTSRSSELGESSSQSPTEFQATSESETSTDASESTNRTTLTDFQETSSRGTTESDSNDSRANSMFDYLSYDSSLIIEAINKLKENKFIVFHTTRDSVFTSEVDVFSETRNKSLEVETKFWYPRYSYYVIILSGKMAFNESLQIRIDFKRSQSSFNPETQTGGGGLFLYEFEQVNNNNNDKK